MRRPALSSDTEVSGPPSWASAARRRPRRRRRKVSHRRGGVRGYGDCASLFDEPRGLCRAIAACRLVKPLKGKTNFFPGKHVISEVFH